MCDCCGCVSSVLEVALLGWQLPPVLCRPHLNPPHPSPPPCPPLLSVSFSSQVSVPALVVNSTHLSSANSSFASPPRGQNLDTLSPIGPTQIRRSASDVRVDQAGKSDRPEGSMQYNSLPRQGSPGRRRSTPAMKQTVS